MQNQEPRRFWNILRTTTIKKTIRIVYYIRNGSETVKNLPKFSEIWEDVPRFPRISEGFWYFRNFDRKGRSAQRRHISCVGDGRNWTHAVQFRMWLDPSFALTTRLRGQTTLTAIAFIFILSSKFSTQIFNNLMRPFNSSKTYLSTGQ